MGFKGWGGVDQRAINWGGLIVKFRCLEGLRLWVHNTFIIGWEPSPGSSRLKDFSNTPGRTTWLQVQGSDATSTVLSKLLLGVWGARRQLAAGRAISAPFARWPHSEIVPFFC